MSETVRPSASSSSKSGAGSPALKRMHPTLAERPRAPAASRGREPAMSDGKIDQQAVESESTSDGDGGDVADQRNPDTIQREIEQTRAELADTIDAIADRISPRRAASRGATAVKSSVTGLFGSDGSDGSNGANGSAPASVLD